MKRRYGEVRIQYHLSLVFEGMVCARAHQSGSDSAESQAKVGPQQELRNGNRYVEWPCFPAISDLTVGE